MKHEKTYDDVGENQFGDIESYLDKDIGAELDSLSKSIKNEQYEDSKQDIQKKRIRSSYKPTSRLLSKCKDFGQGIENKSAQPLSTPSSRLLDKYEYFSKYYMITKFSKSWTQDEEEQMFELVKTIGENWSAISKFITSKTPEEIEQH